MNEKNKDEKSNNLDSSDKFYLDFSVEGTISSSEKEIDKLKEELSGMISKILKDKHLKNVNIRLSKFSELELLMSESFSQGDEGYH